MDPWLVWLIAAVVFAVGEAVTLGLFLAPFAGGALVAAILAGVGVGSFAEWAAFLAVSVALLLALRPLARSHRRMPHQIRTGTAALIGKPAVVLERVANHEGVGLVRIDGDTWTARAYDEDQVIEPGARVQVVEIRGAIALVAE
jgi:membrane protein implicated in regulation of membrane protease activity